MNSTHNLHDICSAFLRLFVFSECKFTLLNEGRRKLDFLDELFEKVSHLIGRENETITSDEYDNFLLLCRDTQIAYAKMLMKSITAYSKQNNDISRHIQPIKRCTKEVIRLGCSRQALEEMENIIREVDSSIDAPLCQMVPHKDNEIILRDIDSLVSRGNAIHDRIAEELEQFVRTYEKYADLIIDNRECAIAHSPKPFMWEFYSFFTHYSFAAIASESAQKAENIEQKTMHLMSVIHNLDRGEKHLHRGALDIYKVVTLIKSKTGMIKTFDSLRAILKARHTEVHNTSNSLSCKIELYQEALAGC